MKRFVKFLLFVVMSFFSYPIQNQVSGAYCKSAIDVTSKFMKTSSVEPLETQIKNYLVKNGEIEADDNLAFRYFDLNNDAKNEIGVTNLSVSGNGWGLHFIFLANPLRVLLKLEGEVDYIVVNSTTSGFKNIKGLYKDGSNLYKWNGKEYK